MIIKRKKVMTDPAFENGHGGIRGSGAKRPSEWRVEPLVGVQRVETTPSENALRAGPPN